MTANSPSCHASAAPIMDSSPVKNAEPTLPTPVASGSTSSTTVGVKRPAPSLLPAFEPLSSSPGFPRPLKRQAGAGSFGNSSSAYLKYPTPVPTSSTGILSSSPPRNSAVPGTLSETLQVSKSPTNGAGAAAAPTRPGGGLKRTQSALSERAPLSAVPSIELSENGETLLLGRSSNSSQYQLSANRLVSRVHVKARYIPATTPMEPNKIEIICNGWNGLKLHCQGRTWELQKGDSFTSETEGTEMMLDVQDTRVLIQWPRCRDRNHEVLAGLSDSSWDDSPRSVRAADNRDENNGAPGRGGLQGSPLRRATRIQSPESPTPAMLSSSQRLRDLLPDGGLGGDEADDGVVEIYEDGSDDDQELPLPRVGDEAETFYHQSMATEATNSFSSDLSEPDENDDDAENDPDEENDPIVHSFGPFGANLSNRLASITASGSPKARASQKRNAASSPRHVRLQPIAEDGRDSSMNGDLGVVKQSVETADDKEPGPAVRYNKAALTNHAINQLAFSRLSSTPLSTIMNNLPAEEKKDLAKEELRLMIEGTACIGIIPREGKDAAGQPLESEYYYIPEMDADESRKAAVVDGLRKPSLRNCRKQHKQYYWKRPRTP